MWGWVIYSSDTRMVSVVRLGNEPITYEELMNMGGREDYHSLPTSLVCFRPYEYVRWELRSLSGYNWINSRRPGICDIVRQNLNLSQRATWRFPRLSGVYTARLMLNMYLLYVWINFTRLSGIRVVLCDYEKCCQEFRLDMSLFDSHILISQTHDSQYF